MTVTVKVIHSIPQWLGQTLTWLYNQVRFLPDEIESHVVCSKTANLDQFGVPNIHVLITASPTWLQYTQKALRLAGVRTYAQFLEQQAREIQADILHSHFGNIGWENMPVAKKLGLKHIVTFYGRDVNYLPQQDARWRERYADLFASVDRVLCEGTFMAAEIVKLGCPAEKVQVQHLGVDVEKVMVANYSTPPPSPLPTQPHPPAPSPQAERGRNVGVGGDIGRSPTAAKIEFRPREWRPGEPLRVLMAASFQEKKGFPYALEALARVKDEIPLEITLIGDAADSDDSRVEKVKILNVIEKYQLKVKMPGYVPYTRLMDEAYANHVFLSPSVTASTGDTEGGAPVALIDMTASGMMVVSTTHCDIPQIVKHGLLAGERDVEGLATHLRWLAANPGAWAGMLAAGRAHVEAEYNAAVQGGRLAGIYRDVVN